MLGELPGHSLHCEETNSLVSLLCVRVSLLCESDGFHQQGGLSPHPTTRKVGPWRSYLGLLSPSLSLTVAVPNLEQALGPGVGRTVRRCPCLWGSPSLMREIGIPPESGRSRYSSWGYTAGKGRCRLSVQECRIGVVTKATLPTPVTESLLTGTAPLLRFIIHQALVIFLLLPPKPHKKQRAFLLSLEPQPSPTLPSPCL